MEGSLVCGWCGGGSRVSVKRIESGEGRGRANHATRCSCSDGTNQSINPIDCRPRRTEWSDSIRSCVARLRGVRARRMGRFDRVGGERGERMVSQGGFGRVTERAIDPWSASKGVEQLD